MQKTTYLHLRASKTPGPLQIHLTAPQWQLPSCVLTSGEVIMKLKNNHIRSNKQKEL